MDIVSSDEPVDLLRPKAFVSDNASESTRRLWFSHGHPYSDHYSNRSLNSVQALVRYAAITYQQQPAFFYPTSEDNDSSYKSISWEKFDRLTDCVASVYCKKLLAEILAASRTKVQPTVALLGKGTDIEFYITLVALQKLAVKVLLPSPALSRDVIQELIDQCKAKVLFVDSDHSKIPLAIPRRVQMIETPFAIRTPMNAPEIYPFDDELDPWDRPSIIIHSSGSTGTPKPIIHTNRSLLLIARMYRLFPSYHIQNWYLLFTLQGITANIILPSGFPHGLPTTFPPRQFPPSPEAIVKSLKPAAQMGYPTDDVHTNPQIIESVWNYINSTTKDFSILRNLKVLQPGGAPLAEHAIKALIQEGINLKQTYGSSELGPLMRTHPDESLDPQIQCMRFVPLPGMDSHVRMEVVEGGFYELVIDEGFPCAAELWGSGLGAQVPKGEVFRTNDLFVYNEAKDPGTWVLEGRRDDILILASGGINVSAAEVESSIVREGKGLVKTALMVGHGKERTGLLVELQTQEDRAAAEGRIWQIIQDLNAKLKEGARVSRQMIMILGTEEVLPVGTKGNVKRKQACETYALEIEALYQIDVEED
ncbi:MAG: hypothetical protein Q9222_003763 [Ikaeria aurantiellina]